MTQIQPTRPTPIEQHRDTLRKQLAAVQPYIDRLIPDPERFGAILLTLARRQPELLKCDPASVIGAALTCAQLALEPGPHEHVYLIPRRNKQTATLDCTVMIGYRGLKALAERSPLIASVRTGTVHEHDTFEWTIQPPTIRHTPAAGDRGAAKLWYAVATRTDGEPPHIAVLNRDDVEARRKCSSKPDDGPWRTHYDAMARKSAIRAIWNELPSSLDMQRAAGLDEPVVVRAPQVAASPHAALAAGDPIDVVDVEATSETPSAGAALPDLADHAAAPAPPASKPQLQLLAILAGKLGWTAQRRRQEAGVESFTHLTRDQASALIEKWQALANIADAFGDVEQLTSVREEPPVADDDGPPPASSAPATPDRRHEAIRLIGEQLETVMPEQKDRVAWLRAYADEHKFRAISWAEEPERGGASLEALDVMAADVADRVAVARAAHPAGSKRAADSEGDSL